MIREAVDTCAFTIYCLCPVILTENYRKLLSPREDKLIFLDISGTPPQGCVTWVESLGRTIIDFVDDDEIQIGMDRIRRTLDQHYSRRTPVIRDAPSYLAPPDDEDCIPLGHLHQFTCGKVEKTQDLGIRQCLRDAPSRRVDALLLQAVYQSTQSSCDKMDLEIVPVIIGVLSKLHHTAAIWKCLMHLTNASYQLPTNLSFWTKLKQKAILVSDLKEF
ncbi:hypothetical protein NP493_250g04088 [Ridgeia piscesae]|uniref:Uncharacterized protein n=1 Tax=Ridgeia piscesae TaxID=27915 RepID=A0AAD9UCX4_RIDPI|nr:hypothetical protein NP493_250g04088 [Ridgeia piscesae]